MKRILASLVCFGMLAVAVPAKQVSAGSACCPNKLGVYVAPKFVYGFTQMNGMRAQGDEGSLRIGNKSDNAWGGALAIGYDFYRQNRIPVRAELEYVYGLALESRAFFKESRKV